MWGAYVFAGITTAYVLWVLWLMRPWGPEAKRAALERRPAKHHVVEAVTVIDHKGTQEAHVYADDEFLRELQQM